MKRIGMAQGAVLALIMMLVAVGVDRKPAVRGATSARIIYVDVGATGAENGFSWFDAYTSLQPALFDAAPGDQIWIAAGVYCPAQTAAVSATFALVPGVTIYGGFAPSQGADTLATRDWLAHPTVLSGDLMGDDAVDARGVVTDTEGIAGTNAWTVVTASAGVTQTAGLDGVWITAGNSDAPMDLCPATGSCYQGGGMWIGGSSPTLRRIAFVGNSARFGGGLAVRDAAAPQLADVRFEANVALAAGGGMHNDSASPVVMNALFRGNRAVDGGGLASTGNGAAPLLANIAFVGNTASRNGGALHNEGDNLALASATFAHNVAQTGGGLFHAGLDAFVQNAIMVQDTASVADAEIAFTGDTFSLLSALITGGCPIDATCVDLITGTAAFVRSPDPGDGDWTTLNDNDYGDVRLRHASPAVDAGDNAYVFTDVVDLDEDGNIGERVPVDLAGMPRISGGKVDLGAYERSVWRVALPVVANGN